MDRSTALQDATSSLVPPRDADEVPCGAVDRKLTRPQLENASATWEAFLRAYNLGNRALIDEGSFAEIPMREYDVLRALAVAGAPLAQSELLEAVVLSQPALSRMLGRMECSGLIVRQRCGEDGRVSWFALTARGRQKQREIGRRHGTAVARLLNEALSEDEIAALQSMCTRIYQSARELL